MTHIQISKNAALWLLRFARQIVEDGIGESYDPDSVTDGIPEGHGFLDDIPMEDAELWRYVNGAITLARALAGIISNALKELNENQLIENDQ